MPRFAEGAPRDHSKVPKIFHPRQSTTPNLRHHLYSDDHDNDDDDDSNNRNGCLLTSSIIRCMGSMARASAGDIPKNELSNAHASPSDKKPPRVLPPPPPLSHSSEGVLQLDPFRRVKRVQIFRMLCTRQFTLDASH